MHPERSRAHLHPKLSSVSLFLLLLPPERERDYLSHWGEWYRWCTRCVAEARDGRVALVLRRPQTAWVALVLDDQCSCVRVSLSAPKVLWDEMGRVNLLSESMYKICVYLHVRLCSLCSGLVASPSHPTILLLHSWLPHPAQLPLGLPPAHPLGRAGVLGAPPPVLPGSCCPQLRSCRRDWGRTKSLLLWLCLGPLGESEEVARRLLQSVLLQRRCLWLCSPKWVIKKDYRTDLLHACSVMARQTAKWQHHLRGWLSCSIFW